MVISRARRPASEALVLSDRQLLDGLAVVEMGSRPSVRFAAMLLAEMGADVVRVVPGGPGAGAEHPLASEGAMRLAWDARKTVVTRTEADVVRLAAHSDVLLTSLDRGGPDAFDQARQGLDASGIQVLLTPFGADGPYSGYTGDDLTAGAFGGSAVFIGAAGRAPVVPPLMLSTQQAGLAAALAVCGALNGPPIPRRIDVGEYETFATNHLTGLYSLAFFLGSPHRRAGRRKPNPYPFTLLPCRDGTVCVAFLSGRQWSRLLEAMGNPEWAGDARFTDRRTMGELYADELDVLVSQWLAERTRAELRDLSLRSGIPLGPLQQLDDVLGDRQLRSRDFFVSRPAGSATVDLPSLPFAVRPAARDDGAARPPGDAGQPGAPLAGTRVIDLTWVMSGPMSSQILADLGADVVKIESRTHLDSSRQGLPLVPALAAAGDAGELPNLMPYFNNVNRGKRSVVLDLRSAGGRLMFDRLMQGADVLVENIGAGALERLGIEVGDLLAANPRLVVLRTSMAGQRGPDAELPGYAPQSTSVGGLDSLCGYRGEDPTGMIAVNYGDVNVALYGALGLLAALRRARQTGTGCVLDLSMIEANALALGPVLAARQLGEIDQSVPGDFHRGSFPHGMFACRGADEWISISVRTDDEWRGLAGLLGLPEDLAGLAGVPARRQRAAGILSAIESWAGGRTSLDAFHGLQESGVPAAPAFGPDELMVDGHVAHRGLVVGVDHHVLGYVPIYGSPFRAEPGFSGVRGRAPDLGEHTYEVLRELGVSDAELTALESDGAFDGVRLRKEGILVDDGD
jgi:crotonobetainyl-CoA:carnitine CoA-transferase CaiB-like acyl-CoA transferase